MPAPVPTWKFWYPLSFWKVVLVFLLMNVALQVICAILREALGLRFLSPAAAGGGAGVASVLIVSNLARKQQERAKARPSAD